MIRCCRFSFIGTAASPSATRFSLSITAKLDFCPGNYIIFMILDIDLSLDPFPLPGEEVETKRKPPQKKSEQIRYRTSREIKNVDRNTYRSIPDREKCRPQSMALNDVGLLLLLDLKEKGIIIVTNFVILFVYIRKYLLATILFCKFELYILPTQG